MQHEGEAQRRGRNIAPRRPFFTSAERQDRMGNNEKSGGKPARSEREKEAERRAQEKALDKALEDSFPASDPIAPSQPTPKLD
ncbi:MAG: hypothetical protein JO220_12540 [Hyphomicrobiales bacterium]|nr:hypothetical protein [Hyphomicrobiales bacterium]